jgi:hypothetical protein
MTNSKKRIRCGMEYPNGDMHYHRGFDRNLVCVRYEHKDKKHRSADGTSWIDDDW